MQLFPRSEHVKLFVILSPVGPYYKDGFKPVKLYADTENVRAWPGGVGNVKVTNSRHAGPPDTFVVLFPNER